MDEKIMVNDILSDIKNSLTMYQNIITDTENISLRQTIQQIRNSDESFGYELFKVAKSKGYYKSSQDATIMEIQSVKNELQ